MKIYVIGRAFPEKSTGMIGLFEFQQAQALSDAGQDVHYIYFDSRSIKVNHKIYTIDKVVAGVKVHGLIIPMGGIPYPFFYNIKSLFYIPFLKKIINKYGYPDVCHIHFPLLSITPEVWNFLKKKITKNVITEHWSKVQKKNIDKYRVNFLKILYAQADVLIAVSSELRKSIYEICGTKREIIVIPNMVSDTFIYKDVSKHDKFTFVSVGRLVEGKGFELLIQAFSDEFKDHTKFQLVIVGGGKLFNNLNKQIKRLGMSSQIFLLGYKNPDEISSLFTDSDCYVTASNFETFGLTVAEAWMAGIPAIAANNIGIRDYFSNKNGLLFEVDDIEDLSLSMKTVYENRKIYDSKMIAEWAYDLFSSKKIAARLIDIYHKDVQQ